MPATRELTAEEQHWLDGPYRDRLDVRRHLVQHRYELAVSAVADYPPTQQTPLSHTIMGFDSHVINKGRACPSPTLISNYPTLAPPSEQGWQDWASLLRHITHMAPRTFHR